MTRLPKCWFMIGLPGSGKTYLREILKGQVLSTDDYVLEYARSQDRTYSEVFKEIIGEAEKALYEDLERAVEKNWDVIWDQTNLTKKARARKLQKLPKYYQKVAVYVPPPKQEEWDDRLARRVHQPISKKIIARMVETFEFPEMNEGFHEIKVVQWGNELKWN